jgi:hypothetical protein
MKATLHRPLADSQPRIKEFSRFLQNGLRNAIVRAARRHEILSEADLQTFCFFRISQWIRKHDPDRIFKTRNKQFLVDCVKYPDIAVLRKNRPWALIELKEQRLLKVSVANKEAAKLAEIRVLFASMLKKMAPKTYVIYLARGRQPKSPKVSLVKGCSFIIIVLKDEFQLSKEAYDVWLDGFRSLAKYEGQKHAVYGGLKVGKRN